MLRDGDAAYGHLPLAKQRCWAHLLRRAQTLTQTPPHEALLRALRPFVLPFVTVRAAA